MIDRPGKGDSMGAKGMFEPQTVLVRSADSLSAPSEDEMVMFNATTDRYYGLDALGSRIWDLLERPRSIAAVADALQQEFDVDAATCLQAVTELAEALFRERLIDRVEP